MNSSSNPIANVTSAIAEAAEYIGAHEALESEAGDTPLAAALILAGARVEAMAKVIPLAKALLDLPHGEEHAMVSLNLAAAIQRAETMPNTREHYEAMARDAQQAAA